MKIKPIKEKLISLTRDQEQEYTNLLKGLFIWGNGCMTYIMDKGSIYFQTIRGTKGKW